MKDFAIWGSPYIGRAKEFGLHNPSALPLTRKGLAHGVAPNIPKEGMYRQGKVNQAEPQSLLDGDGQHSRGSYGKYRLFTS